MASRVSTIAVHRCGSSTTFSNASNPELIQRRSVLGAWRQTSIGTFSEGVLRLCEVRN